MLKTECVKIINGQLGKLAVFDNGQITLSINGKWGGINNYDFRELGENLVLGNVPDSTPGYLKDLLLGSTGELIRCMAQVAVSDDFWAEIKSEIVAARTAIAQPNCKIGVVVMSDGYPIMLGQASHDGIKDWVYDLPRDQSYDGEAKHQIKTKLLVWGRGQNGYVFISQLQLQELLALAHLAQKQEKIDAIKAEIAMIQDRLGSLPELESLPDRATASARRKAYNDCMNEGGEGYLPHFPCKEERQYFTGRLVEANQELSNALQS